MNIIHHSEISEVQEQIADSSTELLEINQKISELLESCSSAGPLDDTDVMMMRMQFTFQQKKLQAMQRQLEESQRILENPEFFEKEASGSSAAKESILLSRQIVLQNILMIQQNITLIDRINHDFTGFFQASDQQNKVELIANQNKWKEKLLTL